MSLLRLPTGRARACGLVAMLALTVSGCEGPMSTGQKSLAGAAAGAAAGALYTGRGSGALVGAGLGAIAGALIGHSQTEERRYGGDDDYPRPHRYAYGRPTDRYGLVRSPYPPHALVDVRGIPPGERVVDPASNRVFINP